MFSVKSLWSIKPNFRSSLGIGELIDELSVKWTDYENEEKRRFEAHSPVSIDIIML